MSSVTVNERVASLETEVRHLTEKVESLESKIDGLLALQNKGVGAFWLASALTGTGIITVFWAFIDWVKHG